jgi:hypothetical protein
MALTALISQFSRILETETIPVRVDKVTRPLFNG